MITDSADIIDFLDSHCTDTQMYWHVKTLYSDHKYELQWVNPKEWRFREVNKSYAWDDLDTWTYATSKTIRDELNNRKVDLVHFEMQLAQKALTIITFAQYIINRGKELFGEETVQSSWDAQKEFEKELMGMIESFIDIPKDESEEVEEVSEKKIDKKPTLTVVKD